MDPQIPAPDDSETVITQFFRSTVTVFHCFAFRHDSVSNINSWLPSNWSPYTNFSHLINLISPFWLNLLLFWWQFSLKFPSDWNFTVVPLLSNAWLWLKLLIISSRSSFNVELDCGICVGSACCRSFALVFADAGILLHLLLLLFVSDETGFSNTLSIACTGVCGSVKFSDVLLKLLFDFTRFAAVVCVERSANRRMRKKKIVNNVT